MKIIKFVGIGVLMVVLLIAFFFINPTERILEWNYDWSNQNLTVKEEGEIKNILKSIPLLSFGDLDKEYLTWSKSNTSKYKKVLKSSQYRVLKRADFFKKIVGDYRIHDFLCKGHLY